MLIAPYGTDAPLYHYPIATIGLIVANVLVFLGMVFSLGFGNAAPEDFQWLLIEFNQINPLQWLTGSFVHHDLNHLIGNMLFLFCFGLVVEGKLGTPSFLALYVASCLVIGAFTQIPMYFLGAGEVESLLGASGVVSTLMVVAFVWAPENEIRFFWLVLFFFGTLDFSITVVCAFCILSDVLTLTFMGFEMSGAIGHLIGALLGIPIAVVLLRNGKVDCEGWDLISRNDWLQSFSWLYGGTQREKADTAYNDEANPVATALAVTGGDTAKSKVLGVVSSGPRKSILDRPKNVARGPRHPSGKRKKRSSVAADLGAAVTRCQRHPEFNRLAFVLRQSLETKNLVAARQTFLRMDALKILPGLADSVLMRYASDLGSARQWVDAIRPLVIVIEKRGTLADDACLRLAQIQFRVLKRKDQAEATLAKIAVWNETEVDEVKQSRIRKRDEMLSAMEQDALAVDGDWSD